MTKPFFSLSLLLVLAKIERARRENPIGNNVDRRFDKRIFKHLPKICQLVACLTWSRERFQMHLNDDRKEKHLMLLLFFV